MPKASDAFRAAAGVAWIRRLYRVESAAEGMTAGQRKVLRRERAEPILAGFRLWMQNTLVDVLPKSPVGQAISYTLSNWEALTRLSRGRGPGHRQQPRRTQLEGTGSGPEKLDVLRQRSWRQDWDHPDELRGHLQGHEDRPLHVTSAMYWNESALTRPSAWRNCSPTVGWRQSKSRILRTKLLRHSHPRAHHPGHGAARTRTTSDAYGKKKQRKKVVQPIGTPFQEIGRK